MALADEVAALPGNNANTYCGMKMVLDQLDEADGAWLRAEVANRHGQTTAKIARALNDRGIDVTAYVFQRHRRGECRACQG